MTFPHAGPGVIPRVGYVSARVFQIPAEEAEEAVVAALDTGYRSLDTARSYSEVAPMVDQVECHPFFQRMAEQQLMNDRGVQIESWGPFAEGRNNLFTDSTLTEIGSAHGKSVAQVVLRWLIQRGAVVVQKSVRVERMRENMDIFDFELADAEMSDIAAMDRGESLFFDHRDPAMASQFANRRLA